MNTPDSPRIDAKPEQRSSELVPELLTPRAVAEKLGVTVKSLYSFGIPRLKFGYRTVRYHPADVVAVLEQRKAEATQ